MNCPEDRLWRFPGGVVPWDLLPIGVSGELSPSLQSCAPNNLGGLDGVQAR